MGPGPGFLGNQSWLKHPIPPAAPAPGRGDRVPGRLELWMLHEDGKEAGASGPIPKVVRSASRGLLGEGSLGVVGAQPLAGKSWLSSAYPGGPPPPTPGGQPPEATVRVREWPVGAQPTPGEAGALRFLPTFVSPISATCPRGTESRRAWRGRRTWTGIFSG